MPDEAYHVFDRIAIRDVFDDVGSKYVPPHVNIFYCFGGLVFTSFIAQVTTGAAMTFYYVPEVSRSLDPFLAATLWIDDGEDSTPAVYRNLSRRMMGGGPLTARSLHNSGPETHLSGHCDTSGIVVRLKMPPKPSTADEMTVPNSLKPLTPSSCA